MSTPSRMGAEAAQDLLGRRDADIVFGEIDAGFEQRDQFQQLLLNRARCGAIRNRPTCCAAMRA